MKCSNHNDTLSRTQREPKTPRTRTAVAAAAPPQRDTERESTLPLVLDAAARPCLRYGQGLCVIAVVTRRRHGQKYAPAIFPADKDVVLAAVTRSGAQLQFASKQLQSDREVVSVVHCNMRR